MIAACHGLDILPEPRLALHLGPEQTCIEFCFSLRCNNLPIRHSKGGVFTYLVSPCLGD
ncbi:conserved hypothetical protein [Roseibium sp. TrichSKD4]|nr:conserved hypothetical protein [Roseibium sp. TrichSKD4]